MIAAEAAADAALIEDYFSVNNEEQIDVPQLTDFDLVPEFCLAAPSVFKFELSVVIAGRVDMVMVYL